MVKCVIKKFTFVTSSATARVTPVSGNFSANMLVVSGYVPSHGPGEYTSLR